MSTLLATIAPAVVLVGAWFGRAALLRPPSGTWPARSWPPIGRIKRAGSGRNLVIVMEKLGVNGRARLIRALWLDLLIIASYVALLGFGVLASRRTVRNVFEHEQAVIDAALTASVVASALLLAGGICALIENGALRLALRRWPAKVQASQGPELEAARRLAAGMLQRPARVALWATRAKAALLTFVLLWLAAIMTAGFSDR